MYARVKIRVYESTCVYMKREKEVLVFLFVTGGRTAIGNWESEKKQISK